MPTREEIAAELLRRGVAPERIAAAGMPQVAQQGRTGMVAPQSLPPDKVAARQVYVGDNASLREQRERLGRYAPNVSQLDRFQALNRVQGTGGYVARQADNSGWENAWPLNWPGMIAGSIRKGDQEMQGMSGIASQLQGQARPVGSGATSDFEQRLYRMGVPSPEKPGPVNGDIINNMKGAIREEDDRLAFLENFLRMNGSLQGSQQAWTRYVTSHPYVRQDGGRTILNDQRKPWQAHFGLQEDRQRMPGGRDATPAEMADPQGAGWVTATSPRSAARPPIVAPRGGGAQYTTSSGAVVTVKAR